MAPTLDDLQPMLLTERKTIPREPGWHYEIKYDGYRMLATGTPRLKSRNGADATAWFPKLVTALSALPAGYILDRRRGLRARRHRPERLRAAAYAGPAQGLVQGRGPS
ncbi:hypothetical protein [Cupriavidus necator]